MYADTAEKLEAATAEVKALQHDAFVSRVLTFLRRQEEWVQLYRLDVLTRGHNTNNSAEATIRVLKDMILNRVEAFNAVALVDSVALVWEKYFESLRCCVDSTEIKHTKRAKASNGKALDGEELVDWVQCPSCERWLERSDTPFETTQEAEADSSFLCRICERMRVMREQSQLQYKQESERWQLASDSLAARLEAHIVNSKNE
ncbi:hypothetical protein MRX96_000364 [Rhipicephalus microplus]